MDATWYRDVNRFAVHTAWAHGFMTAYATYGVGLFALLVIAGWWYARYRPDAPRAVAAAVWAAAATLIAVGINQLIVAAVRRPRPYVTLHGVEVLVARGHDFTFPSDHAIAAGAATAGLWIIARYGSTIIRSLAIVGTVLALFLAFARVYVGAHYPGDVAAGLAIGAAISVLGWLVLSRALTYLATRIAEREPLRPLVIASAHPQRRSRPA
jgi:membrane-associated phospholipid phosphatase